MLRKLPVWCHESSLLPLLTEGGGASLGYRGHRHEQTFGPRAGNVGHVAAENSCTQADERVRS